jgi:tetratricopeptide (TPR) repeat protein
VKGKKRSGVVPLLAAILFLVSCVLLAYGYVEYSISKRWNTAQALKSKEQREEALAEYKALSEEIKRFDWLKTRFQTQYSASEVSRLELLYQLGKYDEVIELADASIQEGIADVPAASFWNGNALFRKGSQEKEPENALPWLHRSMSQYRKALEEDNSGRWNVRFNYELVKTIIEQAENSKEKQTMKILRPPEQRTEEPKKKIAG